MAQQKTIMICQPFGIGDILFVQKILHHYASMNYRVVMPIIDHLSWMRHYIVPHENVEYPIIKNNGGHASGDFKFFDIFMSLSTAAGPRQDTSSGLFKTPIVYNAEDEENSFIFLGIGSSYVWLNDKVMPAKYNFCGLDFSDWADYVKLKRRTHVERELYYDVLGLNDNSRFTLVNEHCSSHSVPLDVPGSIVKLTKLDGFTMLDWALVAEKATQIVTVDTSLVILAEILKQQKPLYMLSRYAPPSFAHVEDILSLKWNLVLTPEELQVDAVA